TTSATFSFGASEPATFECALDGGAYAACTSPQAYSVLAPATHMFAVRATDAAGNVDPTPATRTWTISASAPPPSPASPPPVLLGFDFNGNGTADVAVFRPSNGTWYVRGVFTAGWGAAGDVPVRGEEVGGRRGDGARMRVAKGTW